MIQSVTNHTSVGVWLLQMKFDDEPIWRTFDSITGTYDDAFERILAEYGEYEESRKQYINVPRASVRVRPAK